MIWAPLRSVSCLVFKLGEGGDVPSLGEGHPEDEDELEGVVEGCVWVSPTSRARYLGNLRNQ